MIAGKDHLELPQDDRLILVPDLKFLSLVVGTGEVASAQQQRKLYRQPVATGVRFQSDRMQFGKMQEP
jgi:hypothetical protein